MTAEATPGALGSNDPLGLVVNRALFADQCQRLVEWALIGPVQRAALESFAERLLIAERERWQIEDGHGDRIDALLLKAKDVLARSERPKDCGGTYAVPAAEWLALQEEVMHRLREHAREACGA